MIPVWTSKLVRSLARAGRPVFLDHEGIGSQEAHHARVLLSPTPLRLTAELDDAEHPLFLVDAQTGTVESRRARAELIDLLRERRITTYRCGEPMVSSRALGAPTVYSLAQPDAGRVVVDGRAQDQTTPTETGCDLQTWISERTGRPTGKHVGLTPLRRLGPGAVLDAIAATGPGAAVTHDAVMSDDVAAAVLAVVIAERDGSPVGVHASPTFAALRCGSHASMRDPFQRNPTPAVGGPVLVVLGPDTARPSEVRAAIEAMGGASIRVDRPVPDIVAALRASPAVVVSGRPGEVALLDELASVVGQVGAHAAAVVACGGRTAAAVAGRGMGATTADVLGQPVVGASTWLLRDGQAGVPYVVVSGRSNPTAAVTGSIAALHRYRI